MEPSQPSPIPSQIVYQRVLVYLGKLVEAEWQTKQHPVLSHFNRGKDLVAAFKNQFHSYSLLRYPFDKPLAPGQSVRSWWCFFLEHPEANVLAVGPLYFCAAVFSHEEYSASARSCILSSPIPCRKNAQFLCLPA
jgi:hypothetical protein